MFEFNNLAYEFNFGTVIMSMLKVLFGRFDLVCFVWQVWFGRFNLVSLVC